MSLFKTILFALLLTLLGIVMWQLARQPSQQTAVQIGEVSHSIYLPYVQKYTTPTTEPYYINDSYDVITQFITMSVPITNVGLWYNYNQEPFRPNDGKMFTYQRMLCGIQHFTSLTAYRTQISHYKFLRSLNSSKRQYYTSIGSTKHYYILHCDYRLSEGYFDILSSHFHQMTPR